MKMNLVVNFYGHFMFILNIDFPELQALFSKK